jgi:transposase
MELGPRHGRIWARRKKVDRLPTTYTRSKGIRHLLAFYDVHEDILWGYIRQRKRSTEFKNVLKWMRKRYPRNEKIYLILDNFSPHRCEDVFELADENNVELVFTPTNASWLNRIECQFTELKKFVFDDSYYQEHPEVALAIKKFLNYRNKRNQKRKKT